MVSQQLTPELMQPNVLVEIDPGPSTELYQEAQQPAPGEPPAQMSDTPSQRDINTDPGLDSSSITFQDASTTDYQWDDIYSANQAQVPALTFNKELDMQFTAFSDDEAELRKTQVAPHISPIGQGNAMLYTPHSLADVDESFDDSTKEPPVLKSSSLWRSPKISCECGGNAASIEMHNLGTRTEVVEVGSMERAESVIAFQYVAEGQGSRMLLPRRVPNSESPTGNPMTGKARYRPVKGSGTRLRMVAPGARDDQVSFTTHYVSLHEQPNYVALSHTWGDARNQVVDCVVDGPLYVAKSPGYGWCHPEDVHQWTLLDAPHSIDAERGHPKSVTGLVNMTRTSGSVSVTDGNCSYGCRRPVVLPSNGCKILSKKDFQSDGNEMWMAEADNSDVLGGKPRHHFHYDLPMRDIRGGRLMRSDLIHVEPPSFMSWAAGSKRGFMFEAEEFAREILMWMIEYNLVTTHSEEHKLFALAHQSLGQLLTVMEAAISCLDILLPHQVERNARDKQCTGEVHCLLDDPG